jgi:hypothetical protein
VAFCDAYACICYVATVYVYIYVSATIIPPPLPFIAIRREQVHVKLPKQAQREDDVPGRGMLLCSEHRSNVCFLISKILEDGEWKRVHPKTLVPGDILLVMWEGDGWCCASACMCVFVCDDDDAQPHSYVATHGCRPTCACSRAATC